MQTIAFRMDDITPTMNWERFDRFRRMFERHNVKPLLGIIPDNRDRNLGIEPPNPRFWDIARELKSFGWAISQHGFQHLMLERSGGLLGVNSKSEFAGRPYDDQFQRISSGREILRAQGMVTDIFMPPWHSYDETTLRALEEANFKFVSDGYALFPYTRRNLGFIPCQTSRLPKMPFGVFTVCVHSNIASDETVGAIDAYLSRKRKRVCDFDELLSIQPSNTINRVTEPLVLAVRAALAKNRQSRSM